jgi:hypothetical protein
MTPLVFVTIGVILVFTPLSVLGSVFLWALYREDPTNRLAFVIAWNMLSRTLAAVILAIPTLLFIAGIPTPWSGQLILVAIDILLPTSVVLAGYLWWLRRDGR